jgi:AcrR family transcriptional regulator
MAERGRPRSFDRDTALAAATRLFWQKGFTATSIADLCTAMGIGSPSLYAAFGSKEDLYAEALARYEATSRPLIWSSLTEAPTARAAVEGFLLGSAAALPASSHPGGCMVTLSAVSSEGSDRLGAMVTSSRAKGLAHLEARLARAVEEGELQPSVDRISIARFYLSVQQGMSVQARDGATSDDLRRIAHAAMAAWDSLTQSAS